MPAAGHQPGDGAHERPGQSQRGTRWFKQVNNFGRDISTVKFANHFIKALISFSSPVSVQVLEEEKLRSKFGSGFIKKKRIRIRL